VARLIARVIGKKANARLSPCSQRPSSRSRSPPSLVHVAILSAELEWARAGGAGWVAADCFTARGRCVHWGCAPELAVAHLVVGIGAAVAFLLVDEAQRPRRAGDEQGGFPSPV
jgi:hypothetical protein